MLIFVVVLFLSVRGRVLEETINGVENIKRAIASNPVRHQVTLGSPSEVFRTENAIVTTVLGRTSLGDPGTHERIIDVVGVVSMTTGNLGRTVILSSVASGEAVADGIAGYDYQNNQVYFSSDGAFGGTVFYVEVSNLTALPPTSYYLLPVAYLGFDPVSGSRLITGTNTPTKRFFIMERANWGSMNFFEIPAGVPMSSGVAYNGKAMTYYTTMCDKIGSCTLYTWGIATKQVTSFPLPCVASNGFLSGEIFVNPTNPNLLIALHLTVAQDYSGVTINLSGKSCTLTPLTSIPNKPAIIVATEIGYKSGYLFASVTSNGGNAVMVFDQSFKVVHVTHTTNLYEDIFVQEV